LYLIILFYLIKNSLRWMNWNNFPLNFSYLECLTLHIKNTKKHIEYKLKCWKGETTCFSIVDNQKLSNDFKFMIWIFMKPSFRMEQNQKNFSLISLSFFRWNVIFTGVEWIRFLMWQHLNSGGSGERVRDLIHYTDFSLVMP
jgi:hypothetical protein